MGYNTFLNKLPRKLCILLLGGRHGRQAGVGRKSDLFAVAARNRKQAYDVVVVAAALSLHEQEGEESIVAAVHPTASSGSSSGSRQ